MDGVERLVLAAVTRRGRRLLTRAELLEEGLTERRIDGLVQRGGAQVIHPGVYLMGFGALTWAEREHAAVLSCGGSAMASHRAGLRLWTPDVFRSEVVELAVGHFSDGVPHGAIVHRTRRLTPATLRSGIPCTGIEETLLDATTVVPPIVVERCFTEAWRRHLTTPQKLDLHVKQFGGRGVRGTPLIRKLADRYGEFDRPPGSVAETDLVPILLPALDAAGIEHPELQFVIKDGLGRDVYTVDLGWKLRMAVVEVESLRFHDDAHRHAADIERYDEIEALGYRVLRVAPIKIRQRPEKTVRRILRFLGDETHG